MHCNGDVESVGDRGAFTHMLLALLASPAVPGLRPARPRGKRGMHARARAMRFHWAALDVTNTTACGWTKCYYPSSGERKHTGWLVGRPQCAKFGCPGPRLDTCFWTECECASRGRRDYRTQYTLSLLEKIFREHGTLDYNMAESPDGA